MSRQWFVVGLIIAGLGLGAFTLVRMAPETSDVAIGQPAPDLRLVELAGGDSVSLRTRYRGHVTLVNIWATWCGPCREEMPSMQLAYAALKDRGFRIAAVSIDESDPAPVRRFAQELGLTFDILHDRSTRIQRLYRTTGVPESFLLDADGRIIKRVIGAYNWNSPASRKLIERYLPPAPTAAAGAATADPGAAPPAVSAR